MKTTNKKTRKTLYFPLLFQESTQVKRLSPALPYTRRTKEKECGYNKIARLSHDILLMFALILESTLVL